MDTHQTAVVLTDLMDQLRRHGSSPDEAHLQPAVYVLQELFGLPTGFSYLLYFNSPYSFDLAAELTSLRADFLVEFDLHSPGWGPALVPTPASADLRARFPRTLARYRPPLHLVAAAFHARHPAELDRLATALFVTRQLGGTAGGLARSVRLHELKPHATDAEVGAALDEVDRLAAQARPLAVAPIPA